MTKYTQEQLLAMTNEQRDEIVAQLLGWYRSYDSTARLPSWNCNGKVKILQINYLPSTNKEQAWDLMVKCLDSGLMKNTLLKLTNYSDELTIAVVIAAILHLQEIE